MSRRERKSRFIDDKNTDRTRIPVEPNERLPMYVLRDQHKSTINGKVVKKLLEAYQCFILHIDLTPNG